MYDVWAQNLSPWWSNDRRELNGCLSWFGTGCWSCSKQCFYRLIQTCINNEETIFRNSTLQYLFWNTQSKASNVFYSLYLVVMQIFIANKVSQKFVRINQNELNINVLYRFVALYFIMSPTLEDVWWQTSYHFIFHKRYAICSSI